MDWLTGLLSIGININYDSGNRTVTRGRGEGGTDAQRAAAERARAIGGYRRSTNAGTKYKPNAEDKELIGVTDAILFWASESGVDNSTDDAGNSGLHLTLFDTTTRADSAQIKLLNDSGSTQYVVAAAIKAKPIIRMSGDQGFTHDAFIDYQDIFLSGENTFEFGNNFIVTKAQLEQLADYYAKALGTIATAGPKAKHIYAVSIPGRGWHYEPGEFYTLQVGGAGQREYIDSVVECYDVTVDAGAGELGTTNIAFREVEQNWVKDSNAIARFLATGDPRWKPNNFGRVVVAAKDYLGVADYYCDGTADQTEIQAAIDYLANAFGGGQVRLTEGQFNIAAAIELKTNIILQGAGPETILEKNCNDYAIKTTGAEGTEKIGIELSSLRVTRNAADTNDKDLVYIPYSEIKIDNITVDNCYGDAGIELYYAHNSVVANCVAESNSTWGISCRGNAIKIIHNIARDNSHTGIGAGSSNSGLLISGNTILRNKYFGLTIGGDRGTAIDNVIEENCWSDPASSVRAGLEVASGTGNGITDNYLKDNGTFIARSDCESATPPAIRGEVANTLTQCTLVQSAAQAYEDSNSYLLTKTVAAGTASTAYLTDSAATNDLHGLYAGQEYRFGAWVYIPAGGMLGSELTLVIRDYVAAWEEQAQACALTYDAWQYVEVTKTLRAGSIGATFGFAIASAAANAETAYTDNLRLTPMGTGNLHNQNFYDAGTNTYTGV
jgi:parallel beta-helix repeat protein